MKGTAMKRLLAVTLIALASLTVTSAAFGKGATQATIKGPGLKKGGLGPKYTVAYVMPGPNGSTSTIRQDLYPYAKPYALSYTKPRQPFWDRGQGTHGGWFLTTSAVRSVLDLPAQPPTADTGDGSGWLRWVAIVITIAAGLGLLAALSLVAQRRRPRPATT